MQDVFGSDRLAADAALRERQVFGDAGALLVEEAGGVCTGYAGETFDGSQSAVVTAGPPLHPLLLDALRTTRAALGYPAAPPRR